MVVIGNHPRRNAFFEISESSAKPVSSVLVPKDRIGVLERMRFLKNSISVSIKAGFRSVRGASNRSIPVAELTSFLDGKS